MSNESRPLVIRDGKLSVTNLTDNLPLFTRVSFGRFEDLDENLFNLLDAGSLDDIDDCRFLDLGEIS